MTGIITIMLDDIEIDQNIRLAIFDLMVNLYQSGITEIHMGGMMRILGVDNESASKYDDQVLVLDDAFAKYVKQLTEPRPSDQTLH